MGEGLAGVGEVELAVEDGLVDVGGGGVAAAGTDEATAVLDEFGDVGRLASGVLAVGQGRPGGEVLAAEGLVGLEGGGLRQDVESDKEDDGVLVLAGADVGELGLLVLDVRRCQRGEGEGQRRHEGDACASRAAGDGGVEAIGHVGLLVASGLSRLAGRARGGRCPAGIGAGVCDARGRCRAGRACACRR